MTVRLIPPAETPDEIKVYVAVYVATSPTKSVPSADEELEELKTGEFVSDKLTPFSPFKVDVTATELS